MARKRLSPARPDIFGAELSAAPEATARIPIASMAGDAATAAALGEMQGALEAARREGRMVVSLPLDAVVADHLIRDRMTCGAEDMEALRESLRRRGQQTPIEVTELGGGRYGLISGWRRLRALRELHDESGGLERYGTVQALVRLPQDRPAAYVAMVEENEVRADLSFYERARIVQRAVGAGVFESEKAALQSLFAAASFSKRSKVKSFLPLVAELDGALLWPGQIPERLGLALSKALTSDPAFGDRVRTALATAPDRDAEAERAILEAALAPAGREKPARPPERTVALEGMRLKGRAGRIALEGEAVTEALIEEIVAWLGDRKRG